MPYINPKKRPYLETMTLELADLIIKEGLGEVKNNYVTYVLYLLIKTLYADGDFDKISDGVKVLECACDEFKRRFLHPYEDEKIILNGDV